MRGVSMPPPPNVPPPPPPGPGPWEIPPPGYQNVGSNGFAGSTRIRTTRGLSVAARVLYWLTTGAVALLAYALYDRKDLWDSLVSGAEVSLQELDDADTLVAMTLAPYY